MVRKQRKTSDGPERRHTVAALDAALFDVNDVATLLHCSIRHVYRLVDTGLMPPPIRLGTLVRWSRVAIENWIEDGCPSVQE